jgi:uncharacterized protein involved in outer membrane biogenesis
VARVTARLPRFAKWLLAALVALAVLVVAALFVLQQWVGTDDFRQRVEREASLALGFEVKVERIGLDWWPIPALAVNDVQVLTRPPLTAQRLEVRPSWPSLMAGRPALATAIVRRAVVAQAGVDSIMAALQKKKPPPLAEAANKPAATTNAALAGALLDSRIVLDDVAWQGLRKEEVALDADIRLGADAWPDALQATVRRFQFKGVGDLSGSELNLKRDAAGATPAYLVALLLKGGASKPDAGAGAVAKRGAVKGRIVLLWPAATGSAAATPVVMTGTLTTQDLDVTLLGDPKPGQPPPLSGRLDAQSTLSARAATAGGLLDVLQSRSTFTVRNAVVHGIDLAKAVKTVGLSRGGETRLDVLAGQLHTQGKALQLSNLVASSGALSASGQVAVSPARALSGRVLVELGGKALPDAAKGAVGVPLVVGGTLDAPEVTLTRAAMIGAVVGTAVLPGVGTGAGASLGDKMGEKLKGLFGR